MRGGEVTREPGGVRILGSPSLQRLQVGPGGCDVRGEPLALGYSSLRRGSERGSELGSLLVGSLERRGGRGSLRPGERGFLLGLARLPQLLLGSIQSLVGDPEFLAEFLDFDPEGLLRSRPLRANLVKLLAETLALLQYGHDPSLARVQLAPGRGERRRERAALRPRLRGLPLAR